LLLDCEQVLVTAEQIIEQIADTVTPHARKVTEQSLRKLRREMDAVCRRQQECTHESFLRNRQVHRVAIVRWLQLRKRQLISHT
jgi:hypothetical protein